MALTHTIYAYVNQDALFICGIIGGLRCLQGFYDISKRNVHLKESPIITFAKNSKPTIGGTWFYGSCFETTILLLGTILLQKLGYSSVVSNLWISSLLSLLY